MHAHTDTVAVLSLIAAMVIAVAGTILDAPPPSDGSVLTRVERGLAKLAGRPDEG